MIDEYRISAANIPSWAREWTFDSYPGNSVGLEAVKAWAVDDHTVAPGLCLWGPPGRGKTGLAISALRYRIEAGDGDQFSWMVCSGPRVEKRIASNLQLREPAPIWFERWTDLKSRLLGARLSGGDDIMTARSVLRELDRSTLIALDDVDQDTLSPWKEEQLLFLIERPLRGKRLILTLNAEIASVVDRLGARIVDRLLDPSRFLIIHLDKGGSLRR